MFLTPFHACSSRAQDGDKPDEAELDEAEKELRENLLRAISVLVITESGRAALTAKANVMQSVVDIASMDARSPVCIYAFSTLASLACDDVETKRKVARAGSVRAVCAAMQAQANDPRLQANACRVLANLSAEPSLVTSIVTAGGIRLVCSAMSVQWRGKVFNRLRTPSRVGTGLT